MNGKAKSADWPIGKQDIGTRLGDSRVDKPKGCR